MNRDFWDHREPSPSYSKRRALALMPLRSWVVSPKPTPLPPLTSTTTPLVLCGDHRGERLTGGEDELARRVDGLAQIDPAYEPDER